MMKNVAFSDADTADVLSSCEKDKLQRNTGICESTSSVVMKCAS